MLKKCALMLRPPTFHHPFTFFSVSVFLLTRRGPCRSEALSTAQAASGNHEPLFGGARWRPMGELRSGRSVTWSFCGLTYRHSTEKVAQWFWKSLRNKEVYPIIDPWYDCHPKAQPFTWFLFRVLGQKAAVLCKWVLVWSVGSFEIIVISWNSGVIHTQSGLQHANLLSLCFALLICTCIHHIAKN